MNQPAAQTAFVRAINDARAEFARGRTELQRGAARPSRASALCSTVSLPHINGWLGKVSELTTNSDGDGVISVEVGDKIYLKTWNNSFSDIGSNTLIKSSTPLYSVLRRFRTGDSVRVDGTLFSGGADCFREGSLTLEGSLRSPEFITRFSRIEKVEPL